MFTGLVEAVGRVIAVEALDGGARLTVAAPFSGEVSAGDSVAVDGVCLTVTGHDSEQIRFDVMNESLRRTTLGSLAAGQRVNLERAVRADARLGGHVVTGHVDGVAVVQAVSADGFARRLTVIPPAELLAHVAPQGSVTLAGVSLTVAAVSAGTLTVSLIPETLERTTLGAVCEPGPDAAGTHLNIETDVLAKHVARLVAATLPAQVEAAVAARLGQIGDR